MSDFAVNKQLDSFKYTKMEYFLSLIIYFDNVNQSVVQNLKNSHSTKNEVDTDKPF